MYCSFSLDTSSPSSPMNKFQHKEQNKPTQEVSNLFLTAHWSLFILYLHHHGRVGEVNRKGKGVFWKEGGEW